MDDIEPELPVVVVDGIVPGPYIHFATRPWFRGAWTGISVSEDAFYILNPAIREAIGRGDYGGTYGVTRIPRSKLPAVISTIRALSHNDAVTMTMIGTVADWLAQKDAQGQRVTILGI
tara:strand:- start:135 stop:488 length:354 start_codon:yes stop_codon:yes gene_type:complete